MSSSENLQMGLATAFIDQNISSNLAYRPEFVSNDYKQGRQVLSAIEQELMNCQEFSISVAFIKRSGIEPLLQTLKELEKRKIKGRILTTDYQFFNDPDALDKLHSLNNIELKIFYTHGDKQGFHTKGYIFRKEEIYRIIIGNSNLTASALKINREWNTRLVGYETGKVVGEILREFDTLWNDDNSRNYEDYIDDYRIKYKLIQQQKRIARQTLPVSLEQYRLQPNRMQVAFVKSIKKLAVAGEHKALLISATATGKTYASAFALREMYPQKCT